MLATLNQVLKIAEEKQYAIAAFNTPTLESLQAPSIRQRSIRYPSLWPTLSFTSRSLPFLLSACHGRLAKKASVPVCVHLDHGETLDYLKQALDLGFTSVMYDGSALPMRRTWLTPKRP